MKIKELLAKKSVVQYILYAVSLAGIVADILFPIVDGSDQTFTQGCFLFVLIGSCLGLLDFFFDYGGLCAWGAALCYIVGCGFHLSEALPSVSDLWNGVNFIGGNQEAAIAFGICFLAIALILTVLNFFARKKKDAA